MLTKCKLSMQREVARGMNMVTTTNMSFKMMLYHGAKHDFKTSISYEQFPVLELYEAVKWSGKEHGVRDRWGISAGRVFKPRSRRQRANKFLYHMDQPTCFLLYVLFFCKSSSPLHLLPPPTFLPGQNSLSHCRERSAS